MQRGDRRPGRTQAWALLGGALFLVSVVGLATDIRSTMALRCCDRQGGPVAQDEGRYHFGSAGCVDGPGSCGSYVI